MLRRTFGLTALAACTTIWNNPLALAMESTVAEIPARKIVTLSPTDSLEKPPVVSGMTLDLNGKLLAAVGDDHLVYVFDLDYGRLIQRLAAHTDWVKAAEFRPQGGMLATAGADRHICLWEMSAKGQPHMLPELPTAVSTLAYSPDGHTLAAAGFDDKVWLFNADDGRLLYELAGPGNDLRALAFATNSARVAAAGRTGMVRMWDVASGRQTAEVPVSSRRIFALAYSPNGKLLAAAGQQRVVCLLNAESGQVVATLPERPGEVRTLCFCGDDLLASGSSTNVIHLWQLSTQREVCRFVGHTGSIATLVYDAKNSTLLSGSFDTTVRIWPVSGPQRRELTQR